MNTTFNNLNDISYNLDGGFPYAERKKICFVRSEEEMNSASSDIPIKGIFIKGNFLFDRAKQNDFRDVLHKLDLQAGDLFGFIGPNGAGKTTTMRIIATLLEPTWGEAYVCDHSVHTAPKEIRRLVGYMPDFFGVYDDMTVVEYLEFFAASYRISGQDRRKRVNQMHSRQFGCKLALVNSVWL